MRSLYLKTLLLVVVFFGLPHLASAASFSLSPAVGSFEEGKTFSVKVLMSSTDQAVNAASGILNFPTDKLQVVSVSKSNSILTLWVQDPSFSNSLGTVNFEGVVPNPGFQGSGGTAVTVTFKPIAVGNAIVRFSSGSLLANDGDGTNVIKDMSGATYTLTPAVAVPVVIPTPTVLPVIPTPNTLISSTTINQQFTTTAPPWLLVLTVIFMASVLLILLYILKIEQNISRRIDKVEKELK